jgi:two-component system, NarL family, sensor histidine kinase UhpB
MHDGIELGVGSDGQQAAANARLSDMAGRAQEAAHRATGEQRIVRSPVSALFWRVFLLNGLVFVLGATALVISPATVSAPVAVREVVVLAVGLVVILGVNAALVRASLRSLDGMTSLMERVDLLRPGERATIIGNGDVAHLVRTFNDMLDRLEAERGASAARALAAQEGERQRIAQELHDEIGQSLTAVLLSLRRAIDHAPAELRDELRTVQELVRASLDDVRQVARRLRPDVLEDLGLTSALRALAAEFTGAGGIPVRLRLDECLPPLDKATELVIFRIAQEGLTNVARHADAADVELALTVEDGRIVLRVADNGRGMVGATEGAGIRGMRERAILIGADLSVGPHRSAGTEIRLAVVPPTTAE